MSWFGKSGPSGEARASSWHGGRDSVDGSEESRLLAGQMRHLDADGNSAQRRVLSTYLASRAILGVTLLLVQAVVDALTGRAGPMSWLLCAAYAAQSLVWWLWQGRGQSRRTPVSNELRWSTVGVDAVVFGALHWLDPSSTLNYAALLVLPVLMAGVLMSRTSALAIASLLALALLAVAFRRAFGINELAVLLPQAGLAGMGLFLITLVAGQLAAWLAREEGRALGGLELARQQGELSRLVIDEMSDGVLVVDRQGRVHAANPAARQLLSEKGDCPTPPFSLHAEAGWRSLVTSVEAAYQRGRWPSQGLDLTLAASDEAPRSVRVRARFTRGRRISVEAQTAVRNEVLAVLFLEELRSLLARQRQERLAAMGRVSAGIAHEIRNPLAAVAQANALLQEDALRPDQQRLVRIMADNVERLKRIVDDVMEAAPGKSAPSTSFDANAEVAAICSEWARTSGVALGTLSRLRVDLPSDPLGVSFDVEHLRRVLVNLLDNAWRHAREHAGSVLVTLEAADAGVARLSVASDGDLIAPDVEPHLFEPFHSTRSRGTGLGLYICRELCVRHGGSIDYLRRPDQRHGNVFQVVMRRDSVLAEGRLRYE
ncbi:sensor histidine kinase [Ideonella margarita]|uniref:histidine kinase n=1 Tax=Ideonella margarita TaxID=2984191 RepID=A0ABU9BZH5_9BURK